MGGSMTRQCPSCGGFCKKSGCERVNVQQFERPNPLYVEGWNAALDEAASRIDEMRGFGKTTQDSFAIFIKGLKK